MMIETVAAAGVGKAISKAVDEGFEVNSWEYLNVNGEIFCQLILTEAK